MPSVITLTTDFGLGDAYVAAVKGVILSINPKVTIVDISHVVEPQNIFQAAFLIHVAHRCFPDDTIHLIIVDPGVGSQRRAIVLRTPSAYFLAPDNGVLSYIIDEVCPSANASDSAIASELRLTSLRGNVEAIAVSNAAFWRKPLSTTFHGRDIFAPVAAHLSMGVPMKEFGEPIDNLHTFAVPKPHYDSEGNLVGHVLHIDHFGNLVTNILESDIQKEMITLEVGKYLIHGINRCYTEKEGLVAILGSSGNLEVSFSNGNAAVFLKAKVGDEIKLTTKRRK